MYKAFYKLLPENLQHLFYQVKSVHKYGTRQTNNFYRNPIRTNIKYFNVTSCGINLWNELHVDDNIKLCENVNLFKKQLKEFYIKQYYDN